MNILDGFATDCRTRGMAEVSVKTYLIHARTFQNYLNGKEILQADKLDLRGHIEDLRARGNTTKSIRYHLAALSALYEWLAFEGLVDKNPVIEVRRRYMQRYKADGECQTHKIISVEEAAALVDALIDVRDKAIVILLLKTGIRRGELISLNVDSIDWKNQSLILNSTRKRTNRTVFFDDEAAHYLKRWLAVREGRDGADGKALFLSTRGERLKHGGIWSMIRKAALQTGLHNAESDRMEDHFSAHCCRHWLTTHLLRAGMKREYVQWMRGDAIKEAVDIYFHIDPEDVQKQYLAHVPQLGV